jgi:hypothetical protein
MLERTAKGDLEDVIVHNMGQDYTVREGSPETFWYLDIPNQQINLQLFDATGLKLNTGLPGAGGDATLTIKLQKEKGSSRPKNQRHDFSAALG